MQPEIAEGPRSRYEGIEKAVTVALQLDAARLQILNRDLVAEPCRQQGLGLGLGNQRILEAQGDVGETVFILQHLVEVGIDVSVLGGDKAEPFRDGETELQRS